MCGCLSEKKHGTQSLSCSPLRDDSVLTETQQQEIAGRPGEAPADVAFHMFSVLLVHPGTRVQ